VVGIFPNKDAIVRLVGAILLEQNDQWAVQRARYMTPETIAPLSDGLAPQPSGNRPVDLSGLPVNAVIYREATPLPGRRSIEGALKAHADRLQQLEGKQRPIRPGDRW
jgi:hypothetical protein